MNKQAKTWEETVMKSLNFHGLDDVELGIAKVQAKLTWEARQKEVDEAKKERAKELYEEFICPMCYRLNPQHATADYGMGCKTCSDKEFYCGTE